MIGPWTAQAVVAAVVAFAPAEPGYGKATLDVTLRAAASRNPLAATRVLVVPETQGRKPGRVPTDAQLDPSGEPPAWIRPATTDDEGRLVLDDLPPGSVRILVLAEGYERLEYVVDLSAPPPPRRRSIFVTPDPANAYRTEVAPRPAPKPERVTSRDLSPKEIATLPGTQGDPLRALQNFPGVARAPGGLGLLVLRGASPSQSRTFYGEHPLPRAFHALAFSSVVPADTIGSIDFMPSNAPSRYGDLTGGVVMIEPRRLVHDRVHGYGEIDLAGAGALVRGPLGQGAFLVAAQRGWVDAVLRGVERVDDTQTFTLPSYYDYQALFAYPLKDRQRIEVRFLGAGDRVRTRNFDPVLGERVQFIGIGTHFHRADFVYEKRTAKGRFTLSPTFRFEAASLDVRQESRNIRRDYVTGWRAEMVRRLSRRTSVTVGMDGEVSAFRTRRDTITTQGNPLTGGLQEQTMQGEVEPGVQSSFGAYASLEARFGPVTLWPGVRADAYTVGGDTATSFDPRFSGRWDISDRWAWRFGAGLYSQGLVAQRVSGFDFLQSAVREGAGNVVLPASFSALEPRAGFDPVEGSIRVSRAAQASTAVEFVLDERWSFDVGGYSRLRSNEDGAIYLSPSLAFLGRETYNLDYGLEVLARLRPVGKVYGWLAYTLSRSQVRYLDALGRNDDPLNGPFDQRHILTLLASWALPRRWRLGGRFRLVSGSPYTPFVGVVDQPSGDETQVVTGAENSARFPVFHQLDLRVDKQWIRPRTTFTLYVDVQNVYNRINVEAYVYDYEFRERINAVGLPIFPSIGFRIDF